jgi:hypothetical protein
MTNSNELALTLLQIFEKIALTLLQNLVVNTLTLCKVN